jgi:D-beta-D-heptose 7-phosphate kinase/D-beta-D-heptose 1-phosphate adenosyltransferase
MSPILIERLKEITERFDGAIAVLGDYMLDEYIFGTVNRISPESPVPVVEFVSESTALGGAGNVASNIKALGGRPVPFGFVGNDTAGGKICSAIHENLKTTAEHMLVDSAHPTTVKRRIIAQHQQLLRIDHESAEPFAQSMHDRLLENLRRSICRFKAIVVSDYNKGAITRPVFEVILQASIEAGLPIVLDPKAFDITGVGPVTVITPNEKEAERFTGRRIDGDAGAEQAGQRLLDQTGAEHILITRGESGMSLFTAGGASIHMPTEAREVYDVTGAGDTVVAALSLALAARASVPEAAQIANLAAGIVVGKVGTATASREELASALGDVWPQSLRRRTSIAARIG